MYFLCHYTFPVVDNSSRVGNYVDVGSCFRVIIGCRSASCRTRIIRVLLYIDFLLLALMMPLILLQLQTFLGNSITFTLFFNFNDIFFLVLGLFYGFLDSNLYIDRSSISSIFSNVFRFHWIQINFPKLDDNFDKWRFF